MDEILALVLAILSGVIVSLITLKLAARQRAKDERLAEEPRRGAILAVIGNELRRNRVATRGTLEVVGFVWTG